MRAVSPVARDASGLVAPARVLAVGAHPDDIEFGCGATLAKWTAAGAHVELCVLTDGSKGTWDPDSDLDALVATRREEQWAAARRLGAAEVYFLDRIDGELPVDRATTEALCAVIRASRPAVLLGHDPWKRYRLHPDHHAGGRLVIDALVAARDPHFFPGGGRTPPSRCACFSSRPRWSTTWNRSTTPRSRAKIDGAARAPQPVAFHHGHRRRRPRRRRGARAAFAGRIRDEITAAGGEAFKLLDEL